MERAGHFMSYKMSGTHDMHVTCKYMKVTVILCSIFCLVLCKYIIMGRDIAETGLMLGGSHICWIPLNISWCDGR